MTLLGIRPQPGFGELSRELADHIRASRPIDEGRPVLMPGDRERAVALADGPILVSGATWRTLEDVAAGAGLGMPVTLSTPPGTDRH